MSDTRRHRGCFSKKGRAKLCSTAVQLSVLELEALLIAFGFTSERADEQKILLVSKREVKISGFLFTLPVC